MIYTHLKVWTDKDGRNWHSLTRPGTRELSMGRCAEYGSGTADKLIAWARSQNMTIEDKRHA